jgi:GNAT superfamily N-acetyltransferase
LLQQDQRALQAAWSASVESDRMAMIEVKTFTGNEVTPYLDAIADLRIDVFRDWPYLHAGNRVHERNRLAMYAQSPDSVVVLAFDAMRVIGASIGIPLADETHALQLPFRARGFAIGEVFYFGESVLLKEYRGVGLRHRFFDERERHVRRLGRFRMSAFCAVERDLDDPRRPRGHRSHDAFWTRRGYHRQDDMFSEIEWPVVGHDRPMRHRLRFWLRTSESE